MLTRPDGLDDEQVRVAVERGWSLVVDELAHAPVGFGSHHWRATTSRGPKFVTVDDLEQRRTGGTDTRSGARRRLAAALDTASALRRTGSDFVVAPEPSADGSALCDIDDRFVVAVYPHVDGRTGDYGSYDSSAERHEVVDRLISVHSSGASVMRVAERDDASIPSRDQLDVALIDVASDWSGGPYSEPARALVAEHRSELEAALHGYDRLVEVLERRGAPRVVTHGEPHRGNVIFTEEGAALIDWDTALLAWPERDLWALIGEDASVREHYESGAGRTLDDDALRLHRWWWDLCEVALYVAQFRRAHDESADTRLAWSGLATHLDPARWSGE